MSNAYHRIYINSDQTRRRPMRRGQPEVYMRLVLEEYEPSIVNGEPKSFIKFCIHPNSVHRKTWFGKISEDTEDQFKVLHEILQPITGNNSVQIDMDTFSTISSDTFTVFLSCVPEITSGKRDALADEIISCCRKLVDGSKSVKILVGIGVSTVIYLDEKDMQVVDKYERYYSGKSPSSQWSVAALERLGSFSLNCDLCSICLEKELEGWDVVRMPCLHEFHAKCVVNWLKKRRDCPMCRFMMPSCIFEELFDNIP